MKEVIDKQNLFFENQKLQEEIQKLNAEILQLTTELSKMQKLNQLLQWNNDDLRNTSGLMSRIEQEKLEKEIKDVRDQNSKLKLLVDNSSLETVAAARKKQRRRLI